MQGTGSERNKTRVCTFGLLQTPPTHPTPFFFSASTPIAVGRIGKGWKTESLVTQKKKNTHCSCAIDCDAESFDSIVLEGNHSANCQSAGSQIDPISFYFAEDDLWGYLSCAPREVPPPGFARFKALEILEEKKNDAYYNFKILKERLPLLTACMSWPCRCREKKNKPEGDRRKCDLKKIKNDGGSLRNDGYFGSGKLLISTLLLTPP